MAIAHQIKPSKFVTSKKSIKNPEIISNKLNRSLDGKKKTSPFSMAKDAPEKTYKVDKCALKINTNNVCKSTRAKSNINIIFKI